MREWWFTADEVSRLYGVTPAYVRKMAHAHRWRRRRHGRRVAYLHQDISAWNDSRPASVLARM